MRYGISMADIPLTTGQPDRGAGAYQFSAYTIYDPLVAWEMDVSARPGKLVPGLATEWKVDEQDKKKWRFSLRKGVKFHDGSDFNADAVIWNLEKVFNDKSPQFDVQTRIQLMPRLMGVKNWRKIDDYTVAIGNDKPDAYIPDQVVYLHMSSPAQWTKLGGWEAFARQPSGTGPFKVQEIVPRQRAILVRNGEYWDKNRTPKLDRVILIPTPDASARVAGLSAATSISSKRRRRSECHAEGRGHHDQDQLLPAHLAVHLSHRR